MAEQLLLQPAAAQAVPRGSPLGAVQTASGEVMSAPGRIEPSVNEFWQSGQPSAWAHRWGRDDFGPWATFRIGDVEQRMRWIPAGRFTMGSPEDEEGCWDDEGLQHEVELSRGFWLFDTPCTQTLWQTVTDDNPSQFKGENRPVEQVSWEDCQAFLSELNRQLPGLELRLPTEAQWEYACRAGTTAARYQEDLDAIAWYGDNSSDETHDVGLKHPNAWGLYDMLGNVDEWRQDGMRDYTDTAVVDPVTPKEAGADRVIRGGAWNDSERTVRSAHRMALGAAIRGHVLGFRCSSSE